MLRRVDEQISEFDQLIAAPSPSCVIRGKRFEGDEARALFRELKDLYLQLRAKYSGQIH